MDKICYKYFIEDEKQFYLHEAGFDERELQLFKLRVYEGKHYGKLQKLWGIAPEQ